MDMETTLVEKRVKVNGRVLKPGELLHTFTKLPPVGMMLGMNFRTFRNPPRELKVIFKLAEIELEGSDIIYAQEVCIDNIWYSYKTLDPLSVRSHNGVTPFLEFLEDRAAREMGLVRRNG